MDKIVLRVVLLLLPALILISCGRNNDGSMKPDIRVGFTGDAQIETGGPFEGVEFHHSSPMPQRISFFYPAANSIDLSTDYWRRDTTRVMYAGLRIGYGKKEWIGLNPFSINYTPYGVTFYKKDKLKSISIAYRFCKSKPAMVVIYKITNNGSEKLPFEFYTHLELSLRTSHTYALVKKAWTEYDSNGSAVYANFDNKEVQNCSIFVANAGLAPDSYTTNGNLSTKPFANDWWIRNYASLPELTMTPDNPGIPAASFLYKEDLAPGKSMEVVQIIGSAKQNEGKKLVKYLTANYKKETDDYENGILKYAESGRFSTGDTAIDKSFKWAKAILAANKHYIDGSIVPMPCPAEYNFYFTHDVLVTDYASVNYDIDRVKNDLEFITAHSKDLIIPHAYYWKDSAYVTEYATSDNWNNFWFIITAGSYLKHSGDTAFSEKLYPFVSKCLERTLTNMKSDSLMWEAHLDGSDLGDSYGPRAFMTSLAVKSLKEFLYISSVLHKDDEPLEKYERIEIAMANALNKKLWSDKENFLLNYYGNGTIDPHYYTGSLIAAHFGLLDSSRTEALINSAILRLLDPKIGIYSIYPMDLNKLKSFLKLKDDEAGMPYYYANGGVWAHANAWFALSLIAGDKQSEAFNFIKKIMTVDGITDSPNGQPAMYEYRISDNQNPEVYGKIDKPQFLWAAGWYIYSVYHLFGLRQSSWNIEMNPFLNEGQKTCEFPLAAYGRNLNVKVTGSGKYISSVKINNADYPSAVIPYQLKDSGKIDITLGNPAEPYISETNSRLDSASYNSSQKELSAVLTAFKGHENRTLIISPSRPVKILLNGRQINAERITPAGEGIFKIRIKFTHAINPDKLSVLF